MFKDFFNIVAKTDIKITAIESTKTQDVIKYLLSDKRISRKESKKGVSYKELALKDLTVNKRGIKQIYLHDFWNEYYIILENSLSQ